LGVQAGERVRVAERREGVANALVVRARLERQRALPGRRHVARGVEYRTDLVLAAEPLQARPREHQRVDLAGGELAQARVDVAAQLDYLEILARGAQLRGAAQAARADAGSQREVLDAARAPEHVLDGRTRRR